jgi:hypothetical protein
LVGNQIPSPGNLPHEVVGSDVRAGQIRLPGIRGEVSAMLWTITIVLFILWVLGLVSSYTLGGWIHILLVLAVIVLIFNLLQGRRAL